MEIGGKGCKIPRMSLRQLAWSGTVLLLVGTLLLAWLAVRQQESTLAIRAVHQGTTMPDGFSIWHHLDAHGIPFKSITPKNDTLLITFDSSDQSAAAKAVLDRTLPMATSLRSRTITVRLCSG